MELLEVDLSGIADYLKGLSFKKAAFGGAREDEVYSAMRTLNEMYTDKYKELQELCGAKAAKAEEQSQQFSRLLLSFQAWKEQESETVLQNAERAKLQAEAASAALQEESQREAERLLQDARQEAERLVREAKGQIEEELQSKRSELAGLELRRERLTARLAAFGDGLREMERELTGLQTRLEQSDGPSGVSIPLEA